MAARSHRGRGRRSLAAGIAFLVGSLAVVGCTSDSRVAATATAATKPDYKVTVAGDSISVGIGAELRKHTPGHVVVKVIGEEGTGLARPDRFDWPARLTTLAAEFPPHTLVFSVASNDAQDLRDADGTVVARFDDEAAWEAAYSVRLAAAFDSFAGTDTTVIWLGHVRTTDDRVGLTNRRVHRLASDLAEARDHVLVADLAELLDSGEEAATRCLLEDGLHLTSGCLAEAATGLEALLPDVP